MGLSPAANLPDLLSEWLFSTVCRRKPELKMSHQRKLIHRNVKVRKRRSSLDQLLTFIKVPLQENGTDCGVYAIQFAKLFMRDQDKALKLVSQAALGCCDS